ncbi:hypothetical protein VE04_04456 [Pseudogymnoascus sp. 24MN13]|nr:hypothetical protein VE04_04456 [Pseudogymnoascus sp. 24MN13]
MAQAADTVGLVIGIFLAVGVVTMFSLFCYFRSHFQAPASMYYTEEGNGTELANAGASTTARTLPARLTAANPSNAEQK